VDKQPELIQRAATNIAASSPHLLQPGPTGRPPVTLTVGNVHGGALQQLIPAGTRFDAIHVGAAVQDVPQDLVGLLAVGGRMVLPKGRVEAERQVVVVVERVADTGPSGVRTQQLEAVGGMRFSPLTAWHDDNIE